MARSDPVIETFVDLTSKYAFDEPAWTQEILRVLEAAGPGFLPDLADDIEPVRHPFDRADLPREADRLGSSWMGKIPARRLRIQIVGGLRPYGTVIIGQRGRAPDAEFLELIDAIASLVDPVFGFCHPLTRPELEEAKAVGRHDLSFASPERQLVPSIGFSIWELAERGLPTLYWRTYFGAPLRELFGEALHRAPWARMRSIGPSGSFVGDVSPEPPDDRTYPAFRVQREAIMDALGREAFGPQSTRVASVLAEDPVHRTW